MASAMDPVTAVVNWMRDRGENEDVTVAASRKRDPAYQPGRPSANNEDILSAYFAFNQNPRHFTKSLKC